MTKTAAQLDRKLRKLLKDRRNAMTEAAARAYDKIIREVEIALNKETAT